MGAMTWAQSWLGLADGDQAWTARDQPRIHYSAELIASLEEDHSDLLRQYGDIERAAQTGRYANIPARLAAFKAKFDVHVLNENRHCFGYLEQRLRKSPADLAVIRDFRSEMDAIAPVVETFVKKYRMAGVRPSNGLEFLTELQEVGQLLAQRIRREEEDLHTLYQP